MKQFIQFADNRLIIDKKHIKLKYTKQTSGIWDICYDWFWKAFWLINTQFLDFNMLKKNKVSYIKNK